MRRRPLAWVGLAVSAWIAAGAAAQARVVWTGGGVAFETARWEIPAGRIAQDAPSVSSDLAWSGRLAAHLEVRGSSASGPARERLAPAGSFAALVRYRPGTAWMLQAGAATPSGLRDLDAPSLGLGRVVGEPILALPDPDPARGWRFHVSALWGVEAQRGLGIILGAGGALAGRYDAQRGLVLDPGDEARLQAAISARSGRWRGRLRLTATREGDERVAGVVVRGGRALFGAQLDGAVLAGGARLSLAGDYARSGVCRVPHPEIYGVWLHPGPGSLGAISLAFEPRRALSLGGRRALRPGLELLWRRVTPKNLPVADGTVTGAGARLAIGDGGRELALGASWESGRWRPWEDGARRAATTFHGWRLRVSLLWGRGVGEGDE
jgi:hypothetical protein